MIELVQGNKSKGVTKGITGIVYKDELDNLDPNYLDIHLLHLGRPAFRSPLHDHDFFFEDDLLSTFWQYEYENTSYQVSINNTVRKPKKPHYHVMVLFDGQQSYDQCIAIAKELHFANNYIQQIKSTSSLCRYFIHLDHKYKAQYSPFDCMAFNGFSPDKYFSFEEDKSFIREAYQHITKLIDDGNILYADKLSKLLSMTDDTRYLDLYLGCLHRQITSYLHDKRTRNFDKKDGKIKSLEKENRELSLSLQIYKDSLY